MDEALESAMTATPFSMPAVEGLPVKAATESSLQAEDRVLGVVIDGQPRAYSIALLSQMSHHVICDDVGDTRIAVTFCDRTDCARVLELPENEVVTVAGFREGEMRIAHQGIRYAQSSQDMPLSDVECSTMTWREWLSQYPDSVAVDTSWELPTDDSTSPQS